MLCAVCLGFFVRQSQIIILKLKTFPIHVFFLPSRPLLSQLKLVSSLTHLFLVFTSPLWSPLSLCTQYSPSQPLSANIHPPHLSLLFLLVPSLPTLVSSFFMYSPSQHLSANIHPPHLGLLFLLVFT